MIPGHAARALKLGLAALLFVVAIGPPPSEAAACDEWLRQTRSFTGSYVPVGEPYARPFAFAMLLDCRGTKEVVTVQRAIGTLPVCEARQDVEVVGKLIWNRALVQGHYEIRDPSSVSCRAMAQTTTEPKPQETRPPIAVGRAVGAAPSGVPARTVGLSVWVGRYQDSRGAGDMTFELMRGESTVSGTWKLRTGGGGPVVGSLEEGGRQLQLRMENIAPECPGTFEGSAEITDKTLTGTYRGKDCQGDVTAGHLDLHAQ
jgi:hypothetical protein